MRRKHPYPFRLRAVARHLSEQYLTSSHTFSHFFLHVKGLPQAAQSFWGRSDFFTRFGMAGLSQGIPQSAMLDSKRSSSNRLMQRMDRHEDPA